MENTKNAIQEIKNLLKKFGFLKEEEPKKEETYESFLDLKVKDGTSLMVKGDELIEGVEVTVMTEDSEMPAPDGEYELEDGTKITTKEGKVEKIEKPAEETEETEIVIETAPETTTEPAPEIMELVELMKKVIEKLGEVTMNMETKFNEVDNKINDLSVNVEEFGKLPAGKPIKYEKTETEPETISPLDARVKAIVGLKNKNK